MTRLLVPALSAEPQRDHARGSATVAATVTEAGQATAAYLRELPACVAVLEVRADLAGDLDPGWLRRHFRGRLSYTLRSMAAGGRCADPPEVRHARLVRAARGYDMVDLECERDLMPEVLSAVPPDRRRISWHGGPDSLARLRAHFDRMAREQAQLYLLAPEATSFEQALVPLRLLGELRRRDVTAFATGPAGAWTRVLAPWLGAPVVWGRAGTAPDGTGPDGSAPDGAEPADHAGAVRAGPGPMPLGQLLSDYPFPDMPPLASLYGLVAPATNTSLFVRILNAGCRRLRVRGLYLHFSVADLDDFHAGFWPAVAGGAFDRLGIPVRGLTLAGPFKEVGLTLADLVSPTATLARAANLLVRRADRWRAGTTDGAAVHAALAATGFTAANRPVAVVGCGGAGRATALSLRAAGADVTLVNRGLARGRFAADLLGLPLVGLREFDPARYAAVVHATPARDEVAFDVDRLPPRSTVADFVCAARPTALVRAAQARGLSTVDGRAVLRQEAARHFRQMTGHRLTTVAETR